MWSIGSIIGTYYECFTGNKAHLDFPMIAKQLKAWQKNEPIKKAKVLVQSELKNFIENAPDDDFYLVRKVLTIFGVGGLLRKVELSEIKVENVEFIENDSIVKVSFGRVKAKIHQDSHEFFITDPLMVEKVRKYARLFPDDMKEGRFFRKVIGGK